MKNIRVCKELIKDRHYVIQDENDDYILSCKGGNDKLCIFKTLHDKISISLIQKVTSECKDLSCKRCIIFYKQTVTPMAKKLIQTGRNLQMNIQTMNIKEISFNITHHYLVPKHELVQSSDIIQELQPHKKNLPILKKLDPVSKYYGFKRGDIVRVTRKDNTIMYRVVE